MIPRRWTIADLHFGHEMLVHLQPDGSRHRPFESTKEMDETLVHNWNSVVDPVDTVYVAGDVTMDEKFLPILRQLVGRKILIKGNHDTAPIKEYLKYFADIRACDRHGRALITHVPIHPSQLGGRFKLNIHGHLHARKVMRHTDVYVSDHMEPDPRYVCVSVEQTNYRPVLLDTLLQSIAKEES
jgi:calcineurin-like phosphoesterase family protein